MPLLLPAVVAAELRAAGTDPCPPSESAGTFPPSPCPETRRCNTPAAAVPPLALFSKAAARAEALGRDEAPMIAAALPVASFVVVAGAVEADTGRW